jgi:4'-phosphopantetheinyl transferase
MLKAAWAELEGFPAGISPSLPAWIPAFLIDAALTPAEAARAQGFHSPGRRDQFLIGHALLRLVAGAALGIDPECISLPAEGQPFLAAVVAANRSSAGAAPADGGPPPGGVLRGDGVRKSLWLSLAHSGPYVAAIASDEGPVGVDVERTDRERDWAGLATGMGWGAEASDKRGFLETWTLREAECKAGLAEGAGLVRRAEGPDFVLAIVSAAEGEVEWLGPGGPGPFRTGATRPPRQ